MDGVDSGAWQTRMRWRLRGALTWPLFVVLTAVEAVVAHQLPIAGTGMSIIALLLIAGTINWLVVAVAAPLIALALRRSSAPRAPLAIVTDRVAAIGLLAVAVGFVAAGIAHRPSVTRAHREQSAVHGAVARYVVSQARRYTAGLDRIDFVGQGTGLYRACVPGADARHALCLWVRTDESPPGVTVDPDHTPNRLLFGPG